MYQYYLNFKNHCFTLLLKKLLIFSYNFIIFMPFIYKRFDGFSALLVTGYKICSWAQKNHSFFQETGYTSNKTISRATAILLIVWTTRPWRLHKKTHKTFGKFEQKKRGRESLVHYMLWVQASDSELHRPWGALLWCWLARPQPSWLREMLYSWGINSSPLRWEQHPVPHCLHSPPLLSRGRVVLSTQRALLTIAPCSQLKPPTSPQCS